MLQGATAKGVIGRVAFCVRLKVPGWALPTLKLVMIMTISTDIKVASVPLTWNKSGKLG